MRGKKSDVGKIQILTCQNPSQLSLTLSLPTPPGETEEDQSRETRSSDVPAREGIRGGSAAVTGAARVGAPTREGTDAGQDASYTGKDAFLKNHFVTF